MKSPPATNTKRRSAASASKSGATRGRRLAVAAAIIAAILAAFEIALRLAGYDVPPPGLTNDGTPVAGNAYEPRNTYLDSPFSGATFNVVVAGGAWPFGLGLKRAETFPAILAGRLETAEIAARVVNLSHPDHTSNDVASLLPRALGRYKADLAIVMTGLTDSVPGTLQREFFARKPHSAVPAAPGGLALARLASNLAFALALSANDIDPEREHDDAVRQRSLTQTQSALLEIGAAAKRAGAPLVFITYPRLAAPGWVHPHYPLYHRRNFLVRTAATSFGARLVDLEIRIPREKTPRYLVPWMRWPHPNAAAHAMIADELWPIVLAHARTQAFRPEPVSPDGAMD
ncbi:hypothetical protein K8I61_12110 [bacterium]|nr:hypothetical protein [bacterium]